MLTGTKELSAPGVLFRFHLAFERAFRICAIERRGNVVDTRFLQGAARMGGGARVLFVLVDGWIEWHRGGLGRLEAPVAFAAGIDSLAASADEGRSSGGEPYRAVELIVLDDTLSASPEATRVELSEKAFESARAIFEGRADSSSVTAFLNATRRETPTTEDLEKSIVGDEDDIVHRFWSAFLALDLTSDPFPSFQNLVDQSGLSVSHFSRQIKDVLTTFRFEWGGWRDLTNDARLRWAVVLVSNPTLSIAEVSEAAGYASTDALDATFRRAGLPSPRDVRREILSRVR